MKTLHNLLRIVLVDPPTSFDGMTDLEPMLEERSGPKAGERDARGNALFETRYTEVPLLTGPAFKREKDGRLFVYVGWYGTKDGVRTRFRRLKVYLDAVPVIAWDCEITVAGRANDGSPACATATVLEAKNID